MKKPLLLLFVFNINLFLNASPSEKEILITSVGNMGVSISNDKFLVLIDALHKNYGPDYLQPNDELIGKMVKGVEPFNNIRLSLTTHVHHDHFNEYLSPELLINNNITRVIGTKQIYDSTKSVTDQFDEIKDRILITDNSSNGKKLFDFDDIKITAYNIPHVNQQTHYWVQNTGYLVNISGVKIFHAGDADADKEVFDKLNLRNENIDIVILPVWFLQQTGREIIKIINSKKVIIVHVNPNSAERMRQTIASYFPDITIFTKLEEKFIYTTK